MFCQHMENYVMKGCLNLQWILSVQEVIFGCVKSLWFGGSSLPHNLDYPDEHSWD